SGFDADVRRVEAPEFARRTNDERNHRQRETYCADGDEDLQIRVVAVAGVLHPRIGDIVMQQRGRTRVREGSKTGSEQEVLANEGDLAAPDLGASRQFRRIAERMRNLSPIVQDNKA